MRTRKGLSKLLTLLTKELDAVSKTSGTISLDSRELHLVIGVNYDMLEPLLETLKKINFITDFKWLSPREQHFGLIYNLTIDIPDGFLAKCRIISEQGWDKSVHRVVFDPNMPGLVDLVSGKVIMELNSKYRNYDISKYLFEMKDGDRGTSIYWDEIAEFVAGADKGEENNYGGLKRVIYDSIVNINNAAKEVLGFEIIEKEGLNSYKVRL